MKWHWFIYRLLTRPVWAWGWIRGSLHFPGNSGKLNEQTIEYEKYEVSIENLIQKIANANTGSETKKILSEAEEIRTGEKLETSIIPLDFDASNQLAILCYAVVRIIKPAVIVETGVARGVTSLYILKALEKNEGGHLYSIDLPLLRKGSEKEVGILVPNSLRSRWTLLFGWSIYEMKKLQKKINKIDVFIHDSDHSYINQKTEYNMALGWLNKGGLLISDDVKNKALLESYEKWGGELMVTEQKKTGYIGVLRNLRDD